MKKLFVLFMLIMSVTFGYAQSQPQQFQRFQHQRFRPQWMKPIKPPKIEIPELNLNAKRLAIILDMSKDQMEATELIIDMFYEDLEGIENEFGLLKLNHFDKAVETHLQNMQYYLTKQQFEYYSTLLKTTIRNDFIKSFNDQIKGKR